MAPLKHLVSILFTFFFILKFSNGEESIESLKYELVQTTPEYTYKKTEHAKEIVTSEENAFSITILEDFPVLRKGMLQITPKTFYFYMDYHKLTEVEPGAFDNQNITEEIRLEGNNLTVIRSGTFRNLRIRKLDLAYNQITHIEENAIADMPNLWLVHLSRNKIVQFHPDSFVNTPKMWSLDLSYNQLKKLGRRWFSFMKKEGTVIVGLAYNEIEGIDPEAFELINVWNLVLDHNKLKDIPEEVFEKNDIMLLRLENNQLEDLPDGFFEQKNLTEVTLRNNPLNCGVQEKLKKLAEEIRAKIVYDTDNC